MAFSVDKFASAVHFQVMAHLQGSARNDAVESLQVEGVAYWNTYKSSSTFKEAFFSILQIQTPFQKSYLARVIPSSSTTAVAKPAIASSGKAAATAK